VKYAAIADWAGNKQYPVTFMCAQLGVARQGYYRWLTDGPSEHDRTDEQLTDQIRKIHAELHGHPGVRRIWAELVVRGVRIGRKRVWRLMRAAGLQGRHPRAWKRTTIAGQRPVDAPDLIGQDFTAADPDTRWVGDITYVQTVDGWAYTATVIDLHSRKVVGYAVADHLRTSLVIEALAAALATRKPAAGVIFHSDRGCQGGFQWSSQHLRSGGGPWRYKEGHRRSRRRSRRAVVGSGRRIGRCVRRCVPPDGQSHLVRWSARSGD
jgi:hypothetical protein